MDNPVLPLTLVVSLSATLRLREARRVVTGLLADGSGGGGGGGGACGGGGSG